MHADQASSPRPLLPPVCCAALRCLTHIPQAPSGAKVIDATGKFIMPGGIDPHTHLSMPFMGQVTCDDFYRFVDRVHTELLSANYFSSVMTLKSFLVQGVGAGVSCSGWGKISRRLLQ